MSDYDDELDNIDDEAARMVKQIQQGIDANVQSTPRPKTSIVSEDQLYDKVTSQAGEIIEQGLETINELKNRCVASADPDTIAAFAGLISSTTNAIEVLNKIQLQTLKAKNSMEIERLRHAHKTEQINQKATLMVGNSEAANANLLVASREEIMLRMLLPLNKQATKLVAVPVESDIIDVDQNE